MVALNVERVLARFREESRNLMWEGEVLERLPLVTRRSSANGDKNEVIAFNLNEKNVDAAIQEQINHFKKAERSFEWKALSFDTPPDLVQRLAKEGFSIGPIEKVVIYPLPAGIEPLNADFPCEVKRVENAEQLAQFRSVAERTFHKDYSFTTSQLSEKLATGWRGHEAYIAYVDGVPAAIGRLYTDPGSSFAGLYGGGTLPEFRGQGCYRAIVAARAKDALENSAIYLQVDALPTSLPILLKLGFVPIAETWACTWSQEG